MKFLKSFLIICILAGPTPFSNFVSADDALAIQAIEQIQDRLHVNDIEATKPVFFSSTEILIHQAKPIFDQAPRGLYLTVGAERGLKAASLAEKVTDLLLLDISPQLVRFNHLNFELLKAPTLAEYRKLRYSATFTEWQEFVAMSRSERQVEVHLTQDDFNWWSTHFRDLDSYAYPLPEFLNRFEKDIFLEPFLALHEKLTCYLDSAVAKDFLFFTATADDWRELSEKHGPDSLAPKPPLLAADWDQWRRLVGNRKAWRHAQDWADDIRTAVDFSQVIDFKSSHFLFQPRLYDKLHRMAVGGHLATLQIDLSNPEQLETLGRGLEKLAIPLSVLDLNNLYHPYYIGQKGYDALLNHLLSLGEPHSILLAMSNYLNWGSGQFQTYVGFTFENVRSWPGNFELARFFQSIPKSITQMFNGRLYEKNDLPPRQFFGATGN